jgi:hypothetical protein
VADHVNGPATLRASDADRERVAEALQRAVSEGRLSPDEFEERVSRAYAAKTLGELAPLTADLPEVFDGRAPLPRLDDRPIVAFFGNQRRNGRWIVPARLDVTAALGEVKLDLRDAVLQSRVTTLNLRVLCGNVELIVPEGVQVSMTGTVLAGSRSNKMRTTPGPGAPLIEIDGVVIAGSVKVKPPRRRWS